MMFHILGWFAVAVVAVFLAVNGVFMLASPRAWFRLPGGLLAKGSLTEKKYATGWGAVQVRVTGAIFLAMIAWVVYDSLLRPR